MVLNEGIVSSEHLHDYGKLMFAFVFFWAYIAFSQYMLIWYANIPEETTWFLRRQQGDWAVLALVLLLGHFLLPFLGLISRYAKVRMPLPSWVPRHLQRPRARETPRCSLQLGGQPLPKSSFGTWPEVIPGKEDDQGRPCGL